LKWQVPEHSVETSGRGPTQLFTWLTRTGLDPALQALFVVFEGNKFSGIVASGCFEVRFQSRTSPSRLRLLVDLLTTMGLHLTSWYVIKLHRTGSVLSGQPGDSPGPPEIESISESFDLFPKSPVGGAT